MTTKFHHATTFLLAAFVAMMLVMTAAGLLMRPDTAVDVEPTSTRCRIDLNIADADELALLLGIGEKLAQRIMAYRESQGPFETADDLANVSGIGLSKVRRLQQWVTCNTVNLS